VRTGPCAVGENIGVEVGQVFREVTRLGPARISKPESTRTFSVSATVSRPGGGEGVSIIARIAEAADQRMLDTAVPAAG
jgi:hypothetical protein